MRPSGNDRRHMYEVEVKVRADHGDVRPELRERDARPLGDLRQIDTYYDHPDRSFGETDEALRLRREEDDGGDVTTLVTYKGPLVESASKTREEIETRVADDEAFDAILRALAFEPVADVRKERERFGLGGYTVTLDSVEGVGEFVEVEGEAREAEISAIRDGARELLRDLGLDPEEHVRTSYLEFVLGVDRD